MDPDKELPPLDAPNLDPENIQHNDDGPKKDVITTTKDDAPSLPADAPLPEHTTTTTNKAGLTLTDTQKQTDEEQDTAAVTATAKKSATYESATAVQKGDAVFELTVVNEDGSETIAPVAKRARTTTTMEAPPAPKPTPPAPAPAVVPPAAVAAVTAAAAPDTVATTTTTLAPPPLPAAVAKSFPSRIEESKEEVVEEYYEEDEKPKPKQTRLYFGRDRLLFTTMAKAYIHHEIYKYDCQERWELAINEFYDVRNMEEVVVRKPLIAVKRPFLSGLESRIKALPKKATRNETEEQKLCRQIKTLREEAQAERIRRGQEEPEESRKKRKRAAGPETRGRPRITDIEMSPELEQRYYATQQIRDEEIKAGDAVKDIERQIEELQKRLEDAKEEQKAAAQRAEDASAEFSSEVINGTGPWKEMFVQLQEYEAIHGTVNIIRGQTPEMKALRRWVLRQRERYHMKDDQKSKLPWYCARILESIGFLWRYSDGTWMKFYNELVDYKKEHGDCAVPRGYKPNPKLSQWVKRMRHEGNRFKENPASVSMTDHQFKMLEDIGFIWENLSRSWNERFEDLKKFKAEHGHCRVPKVYPANPKLVSWCQNQRAHHRAFMLGKKTFMDAARKAQLEEVGFEWETGATPGRPPSSPDKKKRARKKKEEVKEESESEEEEAATGQEGNHNLDPDQGGGGVHPSFAVAPVQVYQNHAFAYPNHAYANPYQQQNRGHFYPTL